MNENNEQPTCPHVTAHVRDVENDPLYGIDADEFADLEERDEFWDDDFDYEDRMTDAEADADTLRSCGWGMDEDYGHYGDFDAPWA
jgi:hypothetical protein